MSHDWWAAHKFEFVIFGVLLGLVLVVGLVRWAVEAWRDRGE